MIKTEQASDRKQSYFQFRLGVNHRHRHRYNDCDAWPGSARTYRHLVILSPEPSIHLQTTRLWHHLSVVQVKVNHSPVACHVTWQQPTWGSNVWDYSDLSSGHLTRLSCTSCDVLLVEAKVNKGEAALSVILTSINQINEVRNDAASSNTTVQEVTSEVAVSLSLILRG